MRHLVFDLMEQCTATEVTRLMQLVPKFRCFQALRYKHLFGQFACLKAYELLYLLLKEEGIEEKPIFEVDKKGKPYFQNHRNLYFSISHCKEAIAVVVDNKPVGIDVESYREFSPALLQRTMNEEERQKITSSECPTEQFIRLWTQKEAVLKLRGTGIIDDLNHVLYGPERLYTWSHETKPYACSIATLDADYE